MDRKIFSEEEIDSLYEDFVDEDTEMIDRYRYKNSRKHYSIEEDDIDNDGLDTNYIWFMRGAKSNIFPV